MLRRFLRDGLVYGASSILARGVGLLLLPIYTRALSPAEYGVVDLLQVMRTFAALIVTLEITQGLVRFLPDAASDAERTTLVSTALWFTVFGYAVFAVIGWIFADSVSVWLLGSARYAGAFRAALVYMFADGVFTLLQEQLRFELRPIPHAVSSAISVASTSSLTVALLVWTDYRAIAVFIGLTVGAIAGGVAAWYCARRRYTFRFDRGKLRQLLSFSLPLVPSSIAVVVALYVDRLALRHLRDLQHVGLYGIGFRLASVMNMFMAVVSTALVPLIYGRYTEAGTPREIARIFRAFLAVALPLVVMAGVFAPEVISLMATPDYLPAARVVPLLAASAILSRFWVFAPGLGIAKRTRAIATLNAASAAMNVMLNYLLIPRLGLAGAAVATLVASITTAGAYIVLGDRHYPIPYDWRRLGAAVAASTGLLVLVWLLWGVAPVDGVPGLIGKVALVLLSLSLVAAVLISPAELVSAGRLLWQRIP